MSQVIEREVESERKPREMHPILILMKHSHTWIGFCLGAAMLNFGVAIRGFILDARRNG